MADREPVRETNI